METANKATKKCMKLNIKIISRPVFMEKWIEPTQSPVKQNINTQLKYSSHPPLWKPKKESEYAYNIPIVGKSLRDVQINWHSMVMMMVVMWMMHCCGAMNMRSSCSSETSMLSSSRRHRMMTQNSGPWRGESTTMMVHLLSNFSQLFFPLKFS